MNRSKTIFILIIAMVITSLPMNVHAGSELDIVFIIDESGSMGSDIADVRNQIKNFTSNLQNEGVNYRLGLISYEEDTRVFSMTSNVESFKDNLDSIDVHGGVENGLDAINDAIDRYTYRTHAIKYFVLIGDEEIYSDRGYRDDQTIQRLQNNDIILTSVSISNNRSQFREFSDGTDGLTLNLNSGFGRNLTSIFEQIQNIPKLEVISPSENQMLSDFDSSFIPRVIGSDADSDALTFEYYIDSESTPKDRKYITNTETEHTVNFDAIDIGQLSEGSHRFRFKVSDGSDEVEQEVNVTIDNQAPLLGNVNFDYSDTDINISGSATDNISGLAHNPYRYSINDSSSTWTSQTNYASDLLNPNTEYQVKFEARDDVGHIASKIESICTKSQIPNLIVESSNENSLEISSQDGNPSTTDYQIKVGGNYLDSDGNTVSSPTWIKLNNKRITLMDLTANTSYNIQARTRNQENISTEFSNEITGTTLAKPPTNISLIPQRNSIEISWEEVVGATEYELMADGEIINNGTRTSYIHNSLSPDSQHSYMVRANNSGGAGNWSEAFNEVTLPNPPSTPTNLEIVPSQDFISISWDEVIGATEYLIEVDGAVIENGKNITFTHDNLQPETEHSYRVKAINRGGESNWTELRTETTLPYPPEIPTNVMLEKTKDTVTLTWDEMDRATSYQLQVDGLIIDNENKTTFVHEGLEPLSGHTYKIRAVNRGGKSSWTESIDATTNPEKPDTPENVMATSEENSITITWYKILNSESYDIEVDGNVIEDITDTVYIHDGLDPNTEHVYRVRAKNITGKSNWSKPLTMFTLPEIDESNGNVALTNIIAIVTNNKISLSWDAVAMGAKYQIEVDGELKDIGEDTIFNHTGLEENSFHTYKIRFKDENGTSQWCGVLALATLPNPPDAPKNVEVTTFDNMIELRWNKIDGATGYDVEIDGETIDNGINTSYTHGELEPGTSHIYRVRAKNITGITAWSDAITESTSNPTYKVNCTKEEEFNLSLLASNVQDFTDLKFVVTYDPNEVEVLDLYNFTPNEDLITEGKIEGTNIYVKHTLGRIEFSVDRNIVPGTSWSGEISDILFKSKIDGESYIDYVVE
ncbi:MAG: VWA domain-containing protein [Firmicutes bacterium]|nr:VWA domain-containing protein [Bacillota bacterium]